MAFPSLFESQMCRLWNQRSTFDLPRRICQRFPPPESAVPASHCAKFPTKCTAQFYTVVTNQAPFQKDLSFSKTKKTKNAAVTTAKSQYGSTINGTYAGRTGPCVLVRG